MDELDAIAQWEIQPGWDVIDGDGERIGVVAEVHGESFSAETVAGGVVQVDFGDIESADDGRVNLAMSAGELPTTDAI